MLIKRKQAQQDDVPPIKALKVGGQLRCLCRQREEPLPLNQKHFLYRDINDWNSTRAVVMEVAAGLFQPAYFYSSVIHLYRVGCWICWLIMPGMTFMIPGSVYCNLPVSVCMKQMNSTISCLFCCIYILNPIIPSYFYYLLLHKTKSSDTSDPVQSFSPLILGNQFVNQCTVGKSVAKLFASLCLNLRDDVTVASCKAR